MKVNSGACFVSPFKKILVIILTKAHSSEFVRVSVSTETLVAVRTQDFVRQNSKNTGENTECESLFAADFLS